MTQLCLGFMAVLSVRASPVRIAPLMPRLLAIGGVFGLLAAAVAVAVVGKRGGAHLNPAVTLGFFLRGHVHVHDVLGYMLGQVVGALAAAAIFSAVLGGWAADVHDAISQPGAHIGAAAAIGIETGLTGWLFHDERYVSTMRTELPARPCVARSGRPRAQHGPSA